MFYFSVTLRDYRITMHPPLIGHLGMVKSDGRKTRVKIG